MTYSLQVGIFFGKIETHYWQLCKELNILQFNSKSCFFFVKRGNDGNKMTTILLLLFKYTHTVLNNTKTLAHQGR